MSNTIKHVLILGNPTEMVEDKYPHLDPDQAVEASEVFRKFGGFTYAESISELVDPMAWVDSRPEDTQILTDLLLAFTKRGGVIYIGSVIDRKSVDFQALTALNEIKPDAIVDEAIEQLKRQLHGPIGSPADFEDAVVQAMSLHEMSSEKVVFAGAEEDNVSAFHTPNRASKTHTLKWCLDDTIELDGAILRRTALVGTGHFKVEVLNGQVLTPAEVVGFIAHRMAIVGPDDLVGYGRAFGPGKEDQTNASLTPKGRKFRSQGIIGVVSVSINSVYKAKPDMVGQVGQALQAADPEAAVFLQQMLKEIYEGDAAMEAFRGEREEDGKITLGGKSTKHARVDAGAYCLYTEDGTSEITMPAVIGNFEFSNDGSIYAPLNVMRDIRGYLKESVKAIRDFASMSENLIARYYNSEVKVKDGDRVMPGDVMFVVDGIEHKWESKSDYGIVTQVIDLISTKLVHCEVRIDAWFETDCKMRGFGKGLMAPNEACGIRPITHTNHILIGAAGIIKDSRAATERMSNVRRERAVVEVDYCDRDFELAIAKHNPVQLESTGPLDEGYEDDILVKHYEEKCSMYFYAKAAYGRNYIRIYDDNAIVADITFMIEASPVGQSVGSSGMTLPQIGFLSSLPSANAWLCDEVLPGVIKRTDALAYLHAVANNVPVEL